MYNNVMKKILVIGFVLGTLFLGLKIFAQEILPLKIVQPNELTNQSNIKNNTKTVRVGIGNNNFSSYEWDGATIYSNGNFEVYNNKTYIGSYSCEDEINISTVGNIFVLKDKNDEVIEKVSGPIIFKSEKGLIGIKGLKRAGRDVLYRGDIELISLKKDGKFNIVNQLELEDYLKGVVPNEMPVTFGLEALKAQSVAARNYVLSPRVRASNNYDVVDSVASQVYFGAQTEKNLSNRAVDETYGIVALYNWNLILAQYSSTSGGYSESYSNAFSDPITKKFPSEAKPYLVAKPDYDYIRPLDNEDAAYEFYTKKQKSFDVKSPYYRWIREWNGQEIQDAVQANISTQSLTGFIKPAVSKDETIGIIQSINVLKRGKSGKIIELEIVTDDKTYNVQKELVIRRLLTKDGKALPSANVVFEHEYDEHGNLIYIKANGGGYGHGVGMSQYGAGFMASELNKSFDEILKHYYTDIVLATVPEILSSANRQVSMSFYTKHSKASLVIDNKYKIDCIQVKINDTEYNLELDKTQRYNIIDLDKYIDKGLNTLEFYYPKNNGGIRFYIEIKD